VLFQQQVYVNQTQVSIPAKILQVAIILFNITWANETIATGSDFKIAIYLFIKNGTLVSCYIANCTC
jgi:hypothetical protein